LTKNNSPWLIAIDLFYIYSTSCFELMQVGRRKISRGAFLLVFVGCMSISIVLLIEKRATLNEHPPVHHSFFMVSGQETVFC
jgi:hypothetical protein